MIRAAVGPGRLLCAAARPVAVPVPSHGVTLPYTASLSRQVDVAAAERFPPGAGRPPLWIAGGPNTARNGASLDCQRRHPVARAGLCLEQFRPEPSHGSRQTAPALYPRTRPAIAVHGSSFLSVRTRDAKTPRPSGGRSAREFSIDTRATSSPRRASALRPCGPSPRPIRPCRSPQEGVLTSERCRPGDKA